MNLRADFLSNDSYNQFEKWKQYFPFNEKHLSHFVYKPLLIFEIGCLLGGSLRMWKRYLGPNAQIVGIDIVPGCKVLEDDQIQIRIGEQQDISFLQSLIDEFGTPDIVVDDGSHIQSHVITTFQFLYPKLSKNGIYVVEDIHTSYRHDWSGGLRKEGTFMELCKHLVDELNVDHTMSERHSTAQLPITEFTNTTMSMHFYNSMVIFERGRYLNKGVLTTGKHPFYVGKS